MQTIALLGGGGGIKVWKFWVTSACPRTVQREMFVGATHASLTPDVEKGARHAGHPKKRCPFFGTPTVVVNGQPYIFDCGPGFWRNSQVSTPAYGGKIAALEPKNLTRLFLTHLHFDHTEGLSEFMLAPWIYYREGPLQVYGPPGTEDVVRHLTEAYTKDIDLQMFGLEQLNATGYVIKAERRAAR